jgi:hypothetical protein
MVEYVARKTNATCYSIEIDDSYYKRAERVLGHYSNIKFLLGDSAKVLPTLLEKLDHPAVFWLDGHYSGGQTGRADLDSVVSTELSAILSHAIKGHVILIDDAREFTGHGGYPRLTSVMAVLDDDPNYRAEVSTEIIRITPKR